MQAFGILSRLVFTRVVRNSPCKPRMIAWKNSPCETGWPSRPASVRSRATWPCVQLKNAAMPPGGLAIDGRVSEAKSSGRLFRAAAASVSCRQASTNSSLNSALLFSNCLYSSSIEIRFFFSSASASNGQKT